MIELNFVGLFLWPIQQLDEYLLENGGFPNRDTLNRHHEVTIRSQKAARTRYPESKYPSYTLLDVNVHQMQIWGLIS